MHLCERETIVEALPPWDRYCAQHRNTAYAVKIAVSQSQYVEVYGGTLMIKPISASCTKKKKKKCSQPVRKKSVFQLDVRVESILPPIILKLSY